MALLWLYYGKTSEQIWSCIIIRGLRLRPKLQRGVVFIIERKTALRSIFGQVSNLFLFFWIRYSWILVSIDLLNCFKSSDINSWFVLFFFDIYSFNWTLLASFYMLSALLICLTVTIEKLFAATSAFTLLFLAKLVLTFFNYLVLYLKNWFGDWVFAHHFASIRKYLVKVFWGEYTCSWELYLSEGVALIGVNLQNFVWC